MKIIHSSDRAASHGDTRAFTLIELLVVISIVSMLMAILLPALAKARDAAHTVQCLANVRSLGTAAMAYAADWRGSCPPQVSPSDIASGGFNYTPPAGLNRVMGTHRWAYWADAIHPYLGKNTEVHNCPTGAVRLNTQRSLFGYAITPFTHAVTSAGAMSSPYTLLKVDNFRSPSNKIFFVDSGYTLQNGATSVAWHHWAPYLATSISSSSDNRPAPANRHNTPRGRVDTPGVGPSASVGGGFNAVKFDGSGQYRDWRTTVRYTFSNATGTATSLYWLP